MRRGGYFNNNINNIIQQLLRAKQHIARSRKTTLHHSTQRDGDWLLAMGDWLLAMGYWLLAIGYGAMRRGGEEARK